VINLADSNDLSILEEHRFWLQILGDQADILSFRIDPAETADIGQAIQLRDRFYGLYDQSRQYNLTDVQMSELNRNALKESLEYKSFLILILRKQLLEKYYIGLMPVFVNSFISKTNMYISIIEEYAQGRKPVLTSAGFLGFWLPVLAPYAAWVESNIGIYFNNFRLRAHQYSQAFLNDYVRIAENLRIIQNGMMEDFPLIQEVASEVYDRLLSYATFVVDTMIRVEQRRLPSSLNHIFLDHFYRILCYVTTQMSIILKKDRPACDFTAPRYSIL
jgi:hypothetical protein